MSSASERFKGGDIIRYGSGVSALFRYDGVRNGDRIYGSHVLGGVHSASDHNFFKLQPASTEDIEFCRNTRPEWFDAAEPPIPIDELNRKPRRRIVFIGKIEADSWDDLKATLRHLETEIAMRDRLSPRSISGGYSTGHIIVTSEDGSIDHDSWARELDAYLESLRKTEVPA